MLNWTQSLVNNMRYRMYVKNCQTGSIIKESFYTQKFLLDSDFGIWARKYVDDGFVHRYISSYNYIFSIFGKDMYELYVEQVKD